MGPPDANDADAEVKWLGGREFGVRRSSKLVMARDFWSKRLNHRRLRRSDLFIAVHASPRDSTFVLKTF